MCTQTVHTSPGEVTNPCWMLGDARVAVPGDATLTATRDSAQYYLGVIAEVLSPRLSCRNRARLPKRQLPPYCHWGKVCPAPSDMTCQAGRNPLLAGAANDSDMMRDKFAPKKSAPPSSLSGVTLEADGATQLSDFLAKELGKYLSQANDRALLVQSMQADGIARRLPL